MLFNSYAFIFLFLPIVWVVYQGLAAARLATGAILWLTLASLVYYGYWNPVYLLLIGVSIGVNYVVGDRIAALPDGKQSLRRLVLTAGLTFDLLLLGYFKYTNFLVDNIDAAIGGGLTIERIVLPIGISFFTFQQIAYLVDSYRRESVERDFARYCLFVAFFPQLIAGPIVHHREMMPQFGTQSRSAIGPDLAVGLTIFAIGLFKKVVIADGMARGSTPVFDAVAAGGLPDLWAAWGAAFCYAMQIYFDFSGYSDMAIGLGRMFGIRLPINFASPYKASSIIDFWRRWHITLSRFLRDYLYYPLGGNRRGNLRRYVNVFVTMLLGGIWHGAGWTFFLWGAMHGVFLVCNQLWRRYVPFDLGGRWAGRIATMICVVVAWVPFRAANIDVVIVMYQSMAGANGIGMPAFAVPLIESLPGFAGDLDVVRRQALTSDTVVFLWMPLVLALAWLLPSTQEWMRAAGPALSTRGYPATELDATREDAASWRPSVGVALAIGLLFVVSVLKLDDISEFIYFQF